MINDDFEEIIKIAEETIKEVHHILAEILKMCDDIVKEVELIEIEEDEEND